MAGKAHLQKDNFGFWDKVDKIIKNSKEKTLTVFCRKHNLPYWTLYNDRQTKKVPAANVLGDLANELHSRVEYLLHRECAKCKYESVSFNEEPCKNCLGGRDGYFEPKEKKDTTNTLGEKCKMCIHNGEIKGHSPCVACMNEDFKFFQIKPSTNREIEQAVREFTTPNDVKSLIKVKGPKVELMSGVEMEEPPETDNEISDSKAYVAEAFMIIARSVLM